MPLTIREAALDLGYIDARTVTGHPFDVWRNRLIVGRRNKIDAYGKFTANKNRGSKETPHRVRHKKRRAFLLQIIPV